MMKQRVDPVMVAIVGGLLEWIVKEMTTIMERTSRSAIFKLARDFSDTLFDGNVGRWCKEGICHFI